MLNFDCWAHGARWRHRHPGEKSALALALLTSALLVPPWPGALLVMLLASVLTLYAARLPFRVYTRALALPSAFLLLAGLPLLLEWSPSAPWWFSVSGPGIRRAAEVTARAGAATMGLYLLVFTTPVPDLVGWLRGWRVAGPLADVAAALYRFIFLLLEQVNQLQTAQLSRLGYTSARATWRSSSALAAHVLPRALEEARRRDLAMQSRSGGPDWRTLSDWIAPAPGRLAFAGLLVAGSVWWAWSAT